jgi:hypothetical protein
MGTLLTKASNCSQNCLLIIVFKASVRRRLGAKAQLEVKASRRLEIRRKATVAAEKNLKRGAAAAGRRKSGNGGSESGFGDLRFGPESPFSPLIRGGGSSSRSGGGGWDRRRGSSGGSRGRGGGDGAGAGGCCLCIAAGWLLALVACLEMPEREKERRERRLGVEEERIRL